MRAVATVVGSHHFQGVQEYVHFTANFVSRPWGGFAGAMLVNCVPSLKIT